MKKLVIVFLLLSSFFLRGQNITLSGKIQGPDVKKGGKIFFRKEGEPFKGGDFIISNSNYECDYKLYIPYSRIKQESIDILIFSPDSIISSECVFRVNINNIINSKNFQSLSEIKLKCDLLLSFNCEVVERRAAEDKGNGIFVGRYQLVVNDTIHLITLSDMLYRYTSSLAYINADYMDAEYGSWRYDENTNELVLSIWYEMNEKFGLSLIKRKTYPFIVSDNDGWLTFKSENPSVKITSFRQERAVKVIKKDGRYIEEPLKVERIKTDLPKEYKWKTVDNYTGSYSSIVRRIPENENIDSWTILCVTESSKSGDAITIKNLISSYIESGKIDSLQRVKIWDKDKTKDEKWVLLSVENGIRYTTAKPVSVLYYIVKGKDGICKSYVMVKKKKLVKTFIKKWSKILKKSQIAFEYK